jgi:glutathione S-transferase
MSEVVKIYGSASSGNCWKGKWVADLLGVPNEWIDVDLASGVQRSPEFLKLNPAGQAPVAVLPDGRALAQSNAIMLHLAEGSRLIPIDAYERAKMYEWLFWEQYSHEPAIAVRRALLLLKGKKESELDPSLFVKGHAALARMELQLKQTPYLVGDALSLADIALIAYTRVAHEGGFDLGPYPALQAWIARVERDLNLTPAAEAA